MTQEQMVLKHLRSHKRGITQLEATQKYGILRLSGIIFDLRQDGYKIDTERETSKNRFGVDTTYGRYFLIKEKEDAKK